MSKQNRTEFIRVEKNKNYTMIHNQFLKRNDISWKAKGILAYILSLPDDWNINLNEVMTHATEGERAFRSGWKELKDAGYVEREPVRDGNRIDYWETIVRESVDVKASSELCCFEDVQNEDVQNEDVRNEDVQNDKLPITNITNNLDIPRTKDNKGRKYSFDDTHMELAELLWNHVKTNFPNTKEPNLESWANDIRLMMEQDNRTVAEIKGVIEWSQKHEFWYANIRSANKLRKQYETMFAQADRERRNNKPKKKNNDPNRFIPKELRDKENAGETHRGVNEKHDGKSSLESELDGFI